VKRKGGKVWGAIVTEVNVDQISGKKTGRSSRDSVGLRLIVRRVRSLLVVMMSM